MADTTKFGFINAWARGGEQGLEGLLNNYTVDDGIALSGSISVKEEQADALIAYLSDSNNLTEYGYKLDFAIFYNEEGRVKLNGSITTPYQKDSNSNSKTSRRSKRAI